MYTSSSEDEKENIEDLGRGEHRSAAADRAWLPPGRTAGRRPRESCRSGASTSSMIRPRTEPPGRFECSCGDGRQLQVTRAVQTDSMDEDYLRDALRKCVDERQPEDLSNEDDPGSPQHFYGGDTQESASEGAEESDEPNFDSEYDHTNEDDLRSALHYDNSDTQESSEDSANGNVSEGESEGSEESDGQNADSAQEYDEPSSSLRSDSSDTEESSQDSANDDADESERNEPNLNLHNPTERRELPSSSFAHRQSILDMRQRFHNESRAQGSWGQYQPNRGLPGIRMVPWFNTNQSDSSSDDQELTRFNMNPSGSGDFRAGNFGNWNASTSPLYNPSALLARHRRILYRQHQFPEASRYPHLQQFRRAQQRSWDLYRRELGLPGIRRQRINHSRHSQSSCGFNNYRRHNESAPNAREDEQREGSNYPYRQRTDENTPNGIPFENAKTRYLKLMEEISKVPKNSDDDTEISKVPKNNDDSTEISKVPKNNDDSTENEE